MGPPCRFTRDRCEAAATLAFPVLGECCLGPRRRQGLRARVEAISRTPRVDMFLLCFWESRIVLMLKRHGFCYVLFPRVGIGIKILPDPPCLFGVRVKVLFLLELVRGQERYLIPPCADWRAVVDRYLDTESPLSRWMIDGPQLPWTDGLIQNPILLLLRRHNRVNY